MRQLTRFHILLVNLDTLVHLTRNQPSSRPIKRQAPDAILCLQTTRLRCRFQTLKVVPRRIVPQVQRSIVPTRHEDTIVVHRQRIDDGLVTPITLQIPPILRLPLFEAIGRPRHKGAFKRRLTQGPDRLGMVRQRRHTLAGHQVPQSDGLIVTARNDVRSRRLTEQGADRMLVSGQDVHLMLGPHVPDAGDSVAAATDEQIEGGVEGEGVDATEVAVVVADDLVGFQVPAADAFVFGGAKEVGVAVGKGEAADGANVAGECELEGAFGADGSLGKVPYLDGAVSRASGEELVGGVEGEAADPAEVGGEDCGELPGSVPIGSRNGSCTGIRALHEDSTRIGCVDGAD